MSLRTSSSGTETTSVPSSTIDDLDLDRFEAWLRENARRLAADDVPLEGALLQLRLATTMGNRVHPTIAGLYVFGHEPQFALPQLSVVCARFDGAAITDKLATREDITGPLESLATEALDFVEREAQELVNQVDPEQTALEFPRRAVREAVVNALVHRDLRAGGPVAIRMFEDRLEVWSPGAPSGLPEAIETYLQHGGVSLPRNPLLALLARQMGLAEQLGRGLPLMRRVVEEEAHQDLTVVGSKDGVLVTIPSALDVRAGSAEMMAN